MFLTLLMVWVVQTLSLHQIVSFCVKKPCLFHASSVASSLPHPDLINACRFQACRSREKNVRPRHQGLFGNDDTSLSTSTPNGTTDSKHAAKVSNMIKKICWTVYEMSFYMTWWLPFCLFGWCTCISSTVSSSTMVSVDSTDRLSLGAKSCWIFVRESTLLYFLRKEDGTD